MALLQVRNVSKRFGGLQALNDVNLSIEEGKVHAIIGPNGAGKSTLLNCFVGRLIPDTGTVMFDGKSLLGIKPHQINQIGVSRVFQTPEIFGDLSILENVMIPSFASRDGSFKVNSWNRADREKDVQDHAEAVLQEIGLYEKRHEIADAMSRGDKRRLEMAMCLSQDPKLMLLDEPTAGMSRADTNATIDLLKRLGETRGLTKVIIEHDMHVVFSLANYVSVLAQGTVIAENTPDLIKGDQRVKEAYLGTEAE
jgi:branched-chain amino acid transport system ATP-binding protein